MYSILKKNKPVVLFLSGDYWFYNLKNFDGNFQIASIFDAVGGYAYMLNRAAAELLIKKNHRPGCLADSWYLSRMQGLRLKAIYPYLIDAYELYN